VGECVREAGSLGERLRGLDGDGRSFVRREDELGEPEVEDLHGALPGHHDVVGLHVPVKDAARVRGAEGVGGSSDEPHRLGPGRAAAAHDRRERLPLDELHDQEGTIALGADVEEGDDPGVVQRARRAGLAQEPGLAVGIRGGGGGEHLDGHLAPEALVDGTMDLPHRSAAERGEEPVVRQALRQPRHAPLLYVLLRESRTFTGHRGPRSRLRPMPAIEKHLPGMFCWADLGSTDLAAAKKFYGALFGWTFRDDPMGEGMVYSQALVDGKEAAAVYPAMGGMPSMWMSYICVESADKTAARAEAGLGKILQAPMDVFDSGRMAVVQDPGGATLGLWQPKAHIGTRLIGEHGTICWTECVTTDVASATEFYTSLLGWKADVMDMGGSKYTVFKVGDQSAAGLSDMAGPNVPPHWQVSFMVTSCDDTLAKGKELGGTVLAPAMDIPGVGRFGVLLDPQGASFGILQPAPR
jgi:uncharacterized protein